MLSRILVILTLYPALALAAASDGLIVTYENIPNRVQRDNPSLAAARLRINEAWGQLQQSGRLDNPVLGGGFQHNHLLKEGAAEIGLSQRFPLTNRLELEKDLSKIEISRAEAEVREVTRKIVGEARITLTQILSYREQASLRQDRIEVANKLATFISDAAEKGELSPIDAGQAKLEAAQYRGEIQLLRAREADELGKLKELLGMPPSYALHVVGELPAPTSVQRDLDLNKRPDYQKAQLTEVAARRKIELEQARRYDDIEVGAFVGVERSEDAPEGFENEGIVGVNVKVPLPFWDKNEGNIATAKARAQRARLEVKALSQKIDAQAATARKEMAEWAKLLGEIDTQLIPAAEKQASLSESAYREGLSDLASVLRARDQVLEIAASRIDALRNFHLARVRYETALGS
jgi:cobalt-zinc-cadmium efflux system outer membrane protein